MHRSARQLVSILSLTLLAARVSPARAQEATSMPVQHTVHLVPADKPLTPEQRAALTARGTQRVYVGAERLTLGMPCGGICAGQLYVRGDGSLGSWQIDGASYFIDTGQTLYRTERPPQNFAQGFAIAAGPPGAAPDRAMLNDSGYDAIEFVGEYPRALIRYRARAQAVPPVEVDLEVFSPFIPLEARASAWPATVLSFSVKNPTDHPLNVALGGWLENLVFHERTSTLAAQRRNRLVTGDGVTSVLMDAVPVTPPVAPNPRTRVLADFESGTYAGWTVTGAAFGDAPARGTHPGQQPVSGFGGAYLVNSYTQGDAPIGRLRSDPFQLDLPYLTFRIGGGGHAGRTCLNLVVDGDVVLTATGRNDERLEPRAWDVSPYSGRTAQLEIVDEESGGWGHINVDDLALTNTLTSEYHEFKPEALTNGTLALSLIGEGAALLDWSRQERFIASLLGRQFATSGAALERPGTPLVGTLTRTLALPPGATETVTFLVTWHFPNLHTGQGRMYSNWYADAREVAVRLAADVERLHGLTRRFCDVYYRESTLPWWLNTRLLMPAANLATGTAQWWRNGRFWGWEGAYCCAGTCTHVWNYAQAEAWLFPELVRSARRLQDLGAGFDETSGLVGFRSDRNFAADGQAGTVLKCYREHLTAPDGTFLRQLWSRIMAALEFLVSHDGDENGVIENDRQHNTYDINFVGPNTFVGALYLAALRAGEEMARIMDDHDAAQRYHALYESGRAWLAQHLFNGEYFEQQLPPGEVRPWQYGTGCLSDQLFGQTWAHLLDLDYVLPPEQVRSALAAAYRYNWAPDVGPLNAVYPPERWFARPGEPGLLVCTWPRGARPAEPVRYRDEVWTGIEYQLAAGLLWEALTDPALTEAALRIVSGVEERYDGRKHNPWNEVECGDHYARALASWGVLHALAGYTWNGPAGRISLAPRIQPDEFRCYFAAGTAWGTLAQRRTGTLQTNTIQPMYVTGDGRLAIREFVTQVPAGATVARVEARILAALPGGAGSGATTTAPVPDGVPVAIRFAQAGTEVRVQAEPGAAQLEAGAALELRVHW